MNSSQLMLYLSMEKYFPMGSTFETRWRNMENIVSLENATDLNSCLKSSTMSHPNVHSVWEIILDRMVESGSFGMLWTKLVDNALFGGAPTYKYLGLSLMEKAIGKVSPHYISSILSPNLLRCITNNLHFKDNVLNAACSHAVKNWINQLV